MGFLSAKYWVTSICFPFLRNNVFHQMIFKQKFFAFSFVSFSTTYDIFIFMHCTTSWKHNMKSSNLTLYPILPNTGYPCVCLWTGGGHWLVQLPLYVGEANPRDEARGRAGRGAGVLSGQGNPGQRTGADGAAGTTGSRTSQVLHLSSPAWPCPWDAPQRRLQEVQLQSWAAAISAAVSCDVCR